MAVPQNSNSYPPTHRGVIREMAAESTPDWPGLRPYDGSAPNVVVVLVDDLGYSDISPYGSEIHTPAVEELASDGYMLTNYHTTPVCSPARASLLTGLNPHRAGFASVAHGDPGYPNMTLELADNMPTIAESFRAAGYATYMVGKWHLTKESKLHDGADKSSWPCQRGFDRYFGSLEGFTQLFTPHRLTRDNSTVPVDQYPEDYFLTDDLTDQAVDMLRTLKASEPEKPFFLYFAHHAVHGPLQAKLEDIDRYKDTYNQGWDAIRRARHTEQIRRGLFPVGTPLPDSSEPGFGITPWERLTAEEQVRYARYMAVYAGAVDNVDQNLGRLIHHLKSAGQYENTIFVFTSDNGGSGEGGGQGTRSYLSQFVEVDEFPPGWERDIPMDLADLGGPRSSVHYPRGWGNVSNTPFRYYKGHTFGGGVRAPLVISWAAGLPRTEGDNGVRDQFAYVTDVGQTILALAGVPALQSRHGLKAPQVDGVSFDPWLRHPGAQATRQEQYSEFIGHRFLVARQWKLVTEHDYGARLRHDEWELYDLATDPTETCNLAHARPEVVAELAEKWQLLAMQNGVFPIDDGTMMRYRPATELAYEQPITLEHTSAPLERYRCSKLTNLRSFEIHTSLDGVAAEGVIVSHGDPSGGYVLFVEENELRFTYNEYGRRHRISAPMPAGPTVVGVHFDILPDFRWQIEVVIDGSPVAGLASVMVLFQLAPMTGISVGADQAGPVDWELAKRHGHFPWTGRPLQVVYVPGPKATYNPETLVALSRDRERIFD